MIYLIYIYIHYIAPLYRHGFSVGCAWNTLLNFYKKGKKHPCPPSVHAIPAICAFWRPWMKHCLTGFYTINDWTQQNRNYIQCSCLHNPLFSIINIGGCSRRSRACKWQRSRIYIVDIYIYNLLILPYIIPWYICIRTCIDSAGQRSALHFMNIHDIIWYTVRNTPKPFIFVTSYSKYSTLTCVSETHSIWVPQIVLDCKSIPSQVRKSHTLFPVCDAQTTLAYGMYRSLSVQKVSLTMSYVHSWS